MSELKLYVSTTNRSTATFRVKIALELKNIECELVTVDLRKAEQNSDYFRKLNSMGQVPVLIHDGIIISQSLAIIDYLDSIYPQFPLFAKNDPVLRAYQLQACEIIGSGTSPLFNLIVLQALQEKAGFDLNKKNEWARHWLAIGFTAFEKFIAPHSGQYCFGDKMSAADCFLLSENHSIQRYNMDLTRFPICQKIINNGFKNSSVKKVNPQFQPDKIT